MKKVLSLVLVIAMVLSSMSFAFAGTFTDVTGDYEDAVEALSALGVISGYGDDTFRPENILTRAELAVLLVQSLGYKDLVAGATSNFTDTQNHWSNGYVAIATGTGLVLGYPNGTFQPDKAVSYDEAITMILRAVGYVDSALKGTWPTNFKVKAIDLDLLDGVNMASAAADRGGVAQIIFNALELPMVELGEENVLVKILPERLFIDNIAKAKTITVNANHLDLDHKDYAGNVLDLAPYMYQELEVYMNDAKDVVYIKDSNSVVQEGVLNATGDVYTEDGKTYVVVEDSAEKDHTFIVTTSTAFMVNGVETDLDDVEYTAATVNVTVVLDVAEGDKIVNGLKVDGIVAEKATDDVKIDREYVDGKTKIDSIALPEDDDKVDFDNLVIKGDAETLEDIKEDAIVTVYEGNDSEGNLVKLTLVVSNDTVEGKITKTNADKSVVTVDGTAYDMSAFADDTDVKAGAEGTFFLNAAGEIVSFTKEGSDAPKNYAVVVAATDGTYVTGFGIEKEAQIKLATANDEIVTYKVDEDATLEGGLTNGVDLNPTTLKDQVVEYDLTSDGKIDSIAFVDGLDTDEDLIPESKSFVLADNAVIFDGVTLNSKGNKDYGTLTFEQLDEDAIEADVVYNDNGEIELLFVTNGVVLESDGTYAIITNVELTVNDDEEDVYLITAWVDGAKSEYLTSKTFRTNNPTPSAIKSGAVLRELNLTDGAVSTLGADLATVKAVDDVNTRSSLVKAASAWYGLSEDAVIYLQTKDNTVEVADIYEIEDTDSVKLYNTDTTDDDIEFVIIIKR